MDPKVKTKTSNHHKNVQNKTNHKQRAQAENN